MSKIVFIICDGLGDLPVLEINNQTPLEAAKTPNLDELAKRSLAGLVNPGKLGELPTSEEATLSLLGYDLKTYFPGRGPFECLGIDAQLEKGDVAFRANAGTINDEGVIIDRRAGRISSTQEIIEGLGEIEIEGIKFIFKPGLSHRVAMIARGPGLSAKISDQDPHKTGEKPWEVKPLDDSPEAAFTARILNKFNELAISKLKDLPFNKEREAQGLPPANIILFRGAGQLPENWPTFEEKFGWRASFAAGGPLYIGVARAVGMDIVKFFPEDGVTGLPNSNIKRKVEKGLESLENHDIAFIHIKATDSLAEDGNYLAKRDFIEKIDEALKPVIERQDLLVAITADHTTASTLKRHSTEPVPLIVAGPNIEGKEIQRFTEKECSQGSLGILESKDLLTLLKENQKEN